jgi:S-formylglutathione hydrolase FrmB
MIPALKKLGLLALIAGLLLSFGCSRRHNPAQPEIPEGLDYTGSFYDSVSFWGNLNDDLTQRNVAVYTPPGYDRTSTNARYPTLYLLHGFWGNERYFLDYFSLKEIADEMIAEGEIKPMLIVTPDVSSRLGGGFYTDSDSMATTAAEYTVYYEYTSYDTLGNPAGSTAVHDTAYAELTFTGKYETYIWDDVIEEVEAGYTAYDGSWWEYTSFDNLGQPTDSVQHTRPARDYRGIAGHSMGGYGAMKIAMRHPDLYSSVSAMSAPLALSLIADHIPDLYTENGVTLGDSVGYYTFSPSWAKPWTTMFFSMAGVFTPHSLSDNDTTYFHRQAPAEHGLVGVDLPFGPHYTTGDTLNSTIWNRWLAEDVTTLLETNPTRYAAALDSLEIYIDCGSDDEFGMDLHAQTFDAALTNAGVAHDPPIYYSGYQTIPANNFNFIADRLRAVLKFHSDNFPAD